MQRYYNIIEIIDLHLEIIAVIERFEIVDRKVHVSLLTQFQNLTPT